MAEIYEKGIVVLPKAMRDALGMLPGTKVAFRLETDGIKVLPGQSPFCDMEKLRAELARHTHKDVMRMIRAAEKKRAERLMEHVH